MHYTYTIGRSKIKEKSPNAKWNPKGAINKMLRKTLERKLIKFT